MSYAARQAASANDIEYAKLLVLQTRIEELTTNWITRATELHTATSDASDKTELVLLRNTFDSSLTAILNG